MFWYLLKTNYRHFGICSMILQLQSNLPNRPPPERDHSRSPQKTTFVTPLGLDFISNYLLTENFFYIPIKFLAEQLSNASRFLIRLLFFNTAQVTCSDSDVVLPTVNRSLPTVRENTYNLNAFT